MKIKVLLFRDAVSTMKLTMKLFPAKCHERATLRKLWRQMGQFTVTCEMLTAVARDRWNLSAVFKFCFCFVLLYNKSLNIMTGPLGNSEFCFPQISMFPSTSSREILRFSGNKIHCSPRDQPLSVKCSNLWETRDLTWQQFNFCL